MVDEAEKTTIRRRLAASTVRQMARLADEESVMVKAPLRQQLLETSRGLEVLAQRIERDVVEEKDWAFLSFLNQDGSHGLPATSVGTKPSGSRKKKPAKESPSIPIPPETSAEDATFDPLAPLI
jgi:hypothetical protein